MNIEDFYNYCSHKKGVTESFPFGEDTLVFKVAHKIFALTSLKGWETGNPAINVKCSPEKSQFLREQFTAVKPAYHMNKTHWNTISLNEDLPDANILKLIDHSYELVVKGLPKKDRETLKKE